MWGSIYESMYEVIEWGMGHDCYGLCRNTRYMCEGKVLVYLGVLSKFDET